MPGDERRRNQKISARVLERSAGATDLKPGILGDDHPGKSDTRKTVEEASSECTDRKSSKTARQDTQSNKR